MKKILLASTLLASLTTFASAGDFNLTNALENLDVSYTLARQDKQNVSVVSISKTFFNINAKVELSNKTYKKFTITTPLLEAEKDKYGHIYGVYAVFGYEIYNGRETETVTTQTQSVDQTTTEKEVEVDKKVTQIFIGSQFNYVIPGGDNPTSLYLSPQIGTKSASMEIGARQYFNKHFYTGLKISYRYNYHDYDNTLNSGVYIGYSF